MYKRPNATKQTHVYSSHSCELTFLPGDFIHVWSAERCSSVQVAAISLLNTTVDVGSVSKVKSENL